ncbi:hypothetical protein M3J09_001712 [Ascochyta lentis]
MGPTPPRTPTARKSLPGSPSTTTPNASILGSPIAIQKRKWQGDNVSLPLQGLTQPENVGDSAPVAQMIPTKMQRTGHESNVEYLTMPALPLRNQSFNQNPATFTPRPSQFQQSNQQPSLNDWPEKVFMTAIQSNRNLLSGNPAINPVDSRRIDNIAHAMWQVVFNHENMMRDVTAKVAMFSTLKLRALARLNYLPSWWYLREMACTVMMRQGWVVDDREMQELWRETVEWCGRVEVKMGVHSDSAGASKHYGGDVAQEVVGKVES